MADFEHRWQQLVAAARRAEASERTRPLTELEVAALASLARRPSSPEPRPGPRPSWSGEHKSLAAAALVAVLTVAALLPDPAAWTAFRATARAELAALPERVPRAPRFPSAASTLRLLPDLSGFLHSLPIDAELTR